MQNYVTKYIVWVGGTGDVFTEKVDAEIFAEEMINAGFDDVILEYFKESLS